MRSISTCVGSGFNAGSCPSACIRSMRMPSVRSSCSNSALFASEKRGGDSHLSRAASAAHAVDEVLRDIRQVVVDHVSDILHVNAARSQVGGHHHAVASLLEPCERRVALRLRTVAMNHGGGEAFAAQVWRKFLGSALGARENQAAAGFLAQQAAAASPACDRSKLQTPARARSRKASAWTRRRAAPGCACNRSPGATTEASSVAEKHIVWRSFGRRLRCGESREEIPCPACGRPHRGRACAASGN